MSERGGGGGEVPGVNGRDRRIPFRVLDCCALVGCNLAKHLASLGASDERDWMDAPLSEMAVQRLFLGNPGAASDMRLAAFLAQHRPDLSSDEGAKVDRSGYSEIMNTLPTFVFPSGARFRRDPPDPGDAFIFSFSIHWIGYTVTCLHFHTPVAIKQQVVYAPASLCFLSRVACYSVQHDIAAFVLPFLQAGTCTMSLLEEVVQLASWVPHPLSGAVCLRFFLQGHELIVRPAPQEGLPLIDSHIAPYFHFFETRDLLRVVLSLAFDVSVVVFSSNTALLTPFCQMLLGLLYPLEFLHTFIPLVPDVFSDWVQSPTPMLAGLHASMERAALEGIEESGTEPPVVVHLDTGKVVFPDEEALPSCPSHIVHQLQAAVNQVKKPFALSTAGRPVIDPLHHKQEQLQYEMESDRVIREAFLRTMCSILKRVKECISFKLSPPVLHTETFLSHQPEESQRFFSALIRCSSFDAFVRSRTRDRRDLFDVLCSAGDTQLGSTAPLFFTLALDPAIPASLNSTTVQLSQLQTSQLQTSLLEQGSPVLPDFKAHQADPSPPVNSTPAAVFRTASSPSHNPSNSSSSSSSPFAVPTIEPRGPSTSSRTTTTTNTTTTSASHRQPPLHRHISTESSSGGYGLSSSLEGQQYGTPAPSSTDRRGGHSGHCGVFGSGGLTPQRPGEAPDVQLGSVPSSPLPVPDKSAMFTPQTHNGHKQRLRSLPGSPFSTSATTHTTPFQSYCHQMLAILDDAIEAEKKKAANNISGSGGCSVGDAQEENGGMTSVEKSLLYLRAVYKLGLGQTLAAFHDLDKLREDGINFPMKRVSALISDLSEVEQLVLRESSLVKRSPMWQEIFKMIALAQQSDLPPNMLPDASDTKIESFKELYKACRGPLDKHTFLRWTTTCASCSKEKAELIFTALAAFHDGASIPGEVCQAFFQELRDGRAQLPLSLHKELSLSHGETVIKYQGSVRASEAREIGRLILTTRRLFLARSDSKCRELVRLCDVRAVEKTTHRFKRLMLSQMSALQLVDKHNTSVTLGFFGHRDKWYHFILELTSAHRISPTHGSQLVTRAQQNIILVDAIHKVAGAPSAAADPIIESGHVLSLFAYQTLQQGIQRLSRRRERGGVDLSPGLERKRTVETIVHVETVGFGNHLWCGLGDGTIQLVAVPGFVLEETCIYAHKKRVTSLLQHGNTVWSTGFDCEVCVIDVRTYRILEMLPMPEEHKQPVVSLTSTGGHIWGCGLDGVLFCWSTATRKLTDTVDLNAIVSKRITAFCVQKFADTFWVGCGNRILILSDPNKAPSAPSSPSRPTSMLSPPTTNVPRRRSRLTSDVDPARANLKERLRTLAGGEDEEGGDEASTNGRSKDEGDGRATAFKERHNAGTHLVPPPHRRRSESVRHQDPDDSEPLCRTSSVAFFQEPTHRLRSTITTTAAHGFTRGVNKDIWCFSMHEGVIEVRNMDTLSRATYGGSFTVSCGGFTSIVSTRLCMWASANNGSIYALDPLSHACMMEYTAHTDRVRCLCALADGDNESTVVSGSASNDGTLSVWRQSRTGASASTATETMGRR